jgi:hypothetical protein
MMGGMADVFTRSTVTRVTLFCRECGRTARRDLQFEPGSRGVHETSAEPAYCPLGHGRMARADGIQEEKWRLR